MFLELRCLGISCRRNSRSSALGSSMGHSGKQTILPFSSASEMSWGPAAPSWALENVASMASDLIGLIREIKRSILPRFRGGRGVDALAELHVLRENVERGGDRDHEAGPA